MGNPWRIGGFKFLGGVNREKIRPKNFKNRKKIGNFSLDLNRSKSHWEGNQTPSKLKNRSKNSKNNRKLFLGY